MDTLFDLAPTPTAPTPTVVRTESDLAAAVAAAGPALALALKDAGRSSRHNGGRYAAVADGACVEVWLPPKLIRKRQGARP